MRRQGQNLSPSCLQLSGRRVSNRVSSLLLLLSCFLFLPYPTYSICPGLHSTAGSLEVRQPACRAHLLPVYTAFRVSVLPMWQEGNICTLPLLLYTETFFQNPEGTECQWGGKANSISYFQSPAAHITNSLFKCSPWKIKISITSIL